MIFVYFLVLRAMFAGIALAIVLMCRRLGKKPMKIGKRSSAYRKSFLASFLIVSYFLHKKNGKRKK